jgi:hypothetical protein
VKCQPAECIPSWKANRKLSRFWTPKQILHPALLCWFLQTGFSTWNPRPSASHYFEANSFVLRPPPPRLRSQGRGLWNSRDEPGLLLPEENPDADPDSLSVSNVRYGTVLSGLNHLFLPQELDKRNALSRADGYWPYLGRDDGPPQELT